MSFLMELLSTEARMESKMDQKLDMFLERVAERFGMNNKRPAVAAAADESGDNGSDDNGRVHQMRSKDRKLHRKEVAVSVVIVIIVVFFS
jgi:TFIIF-interacting CTD phosphatase-like protein